MLNEEEKSLVRRLFMSGPAVLFDEGYKGEAISQFLSRADVKAEMDLFQAEFHQQEAISSRTRFMGKRLLTKLSPGAIAMLGQALAGPIYVRDKEGNLITDAKGHPILRQPEPSGIQFAAATQILDRLGVSSDKPVDKSADVNIGLLYKTGDEDAKVVLDTDVLHVTEEQRALSRERVRNAIELLMGSLPIAKEKARVQAQLNAPKETVKMKAKRRLRKREARLEVESKVSE